MTAEWPATFREMHSRLKKIRLHTGEVVDGHKIYTGGKDIYNIMCTPKVIARIDEKKIAGPVYTFILWDTYGCHTR
jgi:hypothetical protein